MKLSRRISRKEGWQEFLIIVGTALFLTLVILLITDLMTYDDPFFPRMWDHHKYIYMAEGNPFDFHIAPFCWRVGLPLLAKALPFELQCNFLIIAFISVWMTGVVVYYLGKRFNFDKVYAYVGMLMFFSLGWATKFILRNFWLPDALLFLLITLSIYCIVSKKDILFLILLIAGIATKETIIAVMPLYYTLNTHRWNDGRLFRKWLLIILPAILLLFSLRIFIPQMNSDPAYLSSLPTNLSHVHRFAGYNYLELLKQISLFRLHSFSLRAFNSYTFGAFGVMLLLLPFFSKRGNRGLLLRFLPFILIVYFQVFFATNTERLLIAAFPAMIILSLNGTASLSEKFSVKQGYFLILPLLMITLNLTGPMDFSGSFRNQLTMFTIFIILIYIIGLKGNKKPLLKQGNEGQ